MSEIRTSAISIGSPGNYTEVIDGTRQLKNVTLPNIAEGRVLGRATGSGTGAPVELTAAQARGALGIAGTVLQVVQHTTASDVFVNSTTWTDTGLSGSITPSSSSSKILVLISQPFAVYGEDVGLGLRLRRGSTVILQDAEYQYFIDINGVLNGAHANRYAVQFLDSPNTTSSVTYSTQVRRSGEVAGLEIYMQTFGESTALLTLIEVAA